MGDPALELVSEQYNLDHYNITLQLIDFMNLFYASLDARISKFKVYNVHTMADEFMVVSGMPNRIGNYLDQIINTFAL